MAQPYMADIADIAFEVDSAHRQDLVYYDRQSGILCVNGTLLPQAPVWAAYFCVYHALQYAYMYAHSDQLPPSVAQSLDYLIMHDGRCARWTNGHWHYVRLTDLYDWENARRNLPCELWAVQEAAEQAYDLLTCDLDRDNMHRFAVLYAPTKPFGQEQYTALFAAIDKAIKQR